MSVVELAEAMASDPMAVNCSIWMNGGSQHGAWKRKSACLDHDLYITLQPTLCKAAKTGSQWPAVAIGIMQASKHELSHCHDRGSRYGAVHKRQIGHSEASALDTVEVRENDIVGGADKLVTAIGAAPMSGVCVDLPES